MNAGCRSQLFFYTGPSSSHCFQPQKWSFQAQTLWQVLPAIGVTLNYISQDSKGAARTAPVFLPEIGKSLTLVPPPPFPASSCPAVRPGRSACACVCVSLQALFMGSPLRFDGRVVLVTGAGAGELAKVGGGTPCFRAAGRPFRAGICAQPQLRSRS